ncbi:CHAT domain-containing protein [Mycena leptocephala]|nr:CHAT domain-containing protein [Mycena leptocephala]
MPAYRSALELLPELSWLGLSVRDRHHHLVTAGQVVRDAVGTAINACEYGTALEWLEQGRSVIWGQILELRTPVDALKHSHPDLAEKFLLLSRQLEDAGTRDTSLRPGLMDRHWEPLHSARQRYHAAANARNLLLKEIRALHNFDRFLLPKTISELSRAAQKGLVVILNVNSWQICDALVLMSGLNHDVLRIPLPEFSTSIAKALEESLRSLLRENGRGEALDGKREGRMSPEDEFAHILSELWNRVAKPILEGIGYKVFMARTTVWIEAIRLCDIFLHAFVNCLDRGIPTRSHSQPIQLLAIAQPSAPGQYYIPGTQKEIDDVQQLAQATNPPIPVIQFKGNEATTLDNVRIGMMESPWVHFACHGAQDASVPIESALLVAGSSRLTLSEIIKMNLPHAELAFLSACETATGAKDLEEESVHLAAGMLTAGYRSVIATMWSIGDNDAPQVAADVYEHLFKTSPPDPTRAAEALHLAVRKLQNGAGGGSHFSTGYHSYT